MLVFFLVFVFEQVVTRKAEQDLAFGFEQQRIVVFEHVPVVFIDNDHIIQVGDQALFFRTEILIPEFC